MATTTKESNTKTTVLKKRTAPEEVMKKEAGEMPIKKRKLPTDSLPETPKDEKVEEKKPTLKKRTLPSASETKEVKPARKNPLDIPTSKKVDTGEEQPAKGKSSLDKMRERIAAQKLLEQEMMTQQALRTQEKDTLRGKLRELSKSLEEENEEIAEVTKKEKPVIDFDLKSEALETQNKKLKKDLEKAKQDLQALLAIEFHEMKVLDPSNLTLSNEFIEAVNTIKEQADLQKDNEEQSLKDELSLLQKELSSVKAKNEAAQKASVEAQKVASEATKAINKAKKAIQEQENDQTRDFKKEIADLEKSIKDKEKEIETINTEKENQKIEFEEKFNTLKNDLESKAKELEKAVKAKEKEVAKLNEEITKQKESNKTLKADFDKSVKENTKLTNNLAKLDDTLNLVKKYEKDNAELNKKLTALEEEKNTLTTSLDNKDKEFKEELDNKLKEQVNTVNDLEKKIAELKANGIENEELKKEKVELENKLNEQAGKIDELLMDYQQQLDDKSKEIEELRAKILEKENQAALLNEKSENSKNEEINKLKEQVNELNLSLTKQTNENELLREKMRLQEEYKQNEKTEDSELSKKCEQYQNLLLSERNSHLQVEQKLCKDLDDYKAEIEKLQAEVTSMSSNYGLSRLNQQVDVIEKFVNDMKNTNKADVNRDVYIEYYEKLIHDYEEESKKYEAEIEKRNKMLILLRDEKIEIVKILKAKGKNTSNIENQIANIDILVNQKLETKEAVKTDKIEEEILNNIKEDLIKYCEDVKAQALKDIEEISNKYENASDVSGLIKEYNNDCDNMTHQYGNEIAKLNLERELNKDQAKQNAIEEKILMVEKQYKKLTDERDLKFNEAMAKIRTQSFEVTKEQLESNYFAFVGEEYIKSLNQYAEMKHNIEEKIENQNKKYQESIENLKKQEETLNNEATALKEKIAVLSNNEELSDEDKLQKQQLLTSLKNNEVKLQNISEYGYNQTEKDHDFIIRELEEDYKKIMDEEKKLKELYEKRETEAKNRLEIEKVKEEEIETAKANKLISDYVYIQGEAERVILSVDEQREKLLEAQQELEALKEENITNKEEVVDIEETTDTSDNLNEETVNEDNLDLTTEEQTEETKEIEEQKAETERIKQDDNVVVSEVNEKEKLSRIRIEDDLDQKDFTRNKELQNEINDLKFQLSENQDVVNELEGKYLRFTEAEKNLVKDFKDISKYSLCVKNEDNARVEVNRLTKELALIDQKANKKAYKVKAAELKSMNQNLEYHGKKVKALRKNKHVDEYIRLVDKIKEFEENFKAYQERNDALKELIIEKEQELTKLKGQKC